LNKTEKVYNEEYIPYIVKWGKSLGLLGVAISFLPVIVLTFVFNITPSIGSIMAGAVAIWSSIAAFWVVEPVSYYPILGIPGTYLAFISGNISNLRLPASAVAQEAAGVEPGTPKGSIISTLGISTSILINVTFLTIGVFAGSAALESLPDIITNALDYILPALFGAIFANFAKDRPKIGVIALTISIIMTALMNRGYLSFLPGIPSYAVIIVSVFGTIFISKKLFEKGIIE